MPFVYLHRRIPPKTVTNKDNVDSIRDLRNDLIHLLEQKRIVQIATNNSLSPHCVVPVEKIIINTKLV